MFDFMGLIRNLRLQLGARLATVRPLRGDPRRKLLLRKSFVRSSARQMCRTTNVFFTTRLCYTSAPRETFTTMLEKDAQKRVARTYKGPRVHIGVEVDDSGAIRKREIPFVVGVLAPLSGTAQPPSWAAQEALEINRLNFDDVMKRIGPRLEFSLPNIPEIDMTFEKIEDLEPESVASKIPILAQKLKRRRSLRDLLNRLRANPRLRSEVEQIVREKARSRAQGEPPKTGSR
jgi:type VI secretion system protein ImpB